MSLAIPKELKPFVDFILHVIFGGLAFLLLFFVAVGTAMITESLEAGGHVPKAIATIMEYAERGFFILDIALFMLFSLVEGLKFIGYRWKKQVA